MKLSPRLKQFYLLCLKIPLVGKYILGPYLRLWWKLISLMGHFFSRNTAPENPVLSTYAATIASLKIRIDMLENRNEHLLAEMEKLRWQIALRFKLESAALEGVHRAMEKAGKPQQ